jgi:hypothetical protein
MRGIERMFASIWDGTTAVVRFSQILENPTGMTEAIKGFGGAAQLETSPGFSRCCSQAWQSIDASAKIFTWIWARCPI